MTCLIIFGVVLLFGLGITYLVYKLAFYNDLQDDIYHIPNTPQFQKQKDKMLRAIHNMEQLSYEEVRITSYDGLQLYGRYYHIADDAPLQILFHGYRGSALRDLCGGHELAREMGHNTLVVDQRSHGNSQGNVITFGIRERWDCLAWANYAAQRFPENPIFLVGVSMGASTVVMAAALDIPANVVGVIADCPFSSCVKIIEKVAGDMHLPVKLAIPFVRLAALLFGRFRLAEASAEEAIRQCKVPVLLIHGEEDLLVPYEMSRKIKNENEETVSLLLVPGAGHGLSYLVDRQLYEQTVRQFVKKCLENNELDF